MAEVRITITDKGGGEVGIRLEADPPITKKRSTPAQHLAALALEAMTKGRKAKLDAVNGKEGEKS